jgi:hypothetical protein
VPDFAFDFADDDLDRHGRLLERLRDRLPQPDASLDEFSKELVVVAPDAARATVRARSIVHDAAAGTDLYLEPQGRGWHGVDPS